MKLAIIHDDLVQFGGAEKVLLALHEIWPDAPVFTSVASGEWRKICEKQKIPLYESFMRSLPNVIGWNREYAVTLAYCVAFERFNLNEYDVVLSASSRFAHGVVTRPETLHICLMHSPGRMFWEAPAYFENEKIGPKFLNKILTSLISFPLSYMRLWDYASAQRVDSFVAISEGVRKKIKRSYNRDAQGVIYPFCDLKDFAAEVQPYSTDPYFLVLSRLEHWKKIDLAVKASNKLGFKLLIAGEGAAKKHLQKIAGPNVKFLGYVSEEDKVRLYKGCQALIFPQREDFGITPLEAMASGKPVIAFGDGGALESVVPGVTGEFFAQQTVDSLCEVITKFNPGSYSSASCMSQAAKFDRELFKSTLKNFVEQAYVSKNQKTN